MRYLGRSVIFNLHPAASCVVASASRKQCSRKEPATRHARLAAEHLERSLLEQVAQLKLVGVMQLPWASFIHHLIHHFIQHHHSTHKNPSNLLSPTHFHHSNFLTFTPNFLTFLLKIHHSLLNFHYHNLQIINSLYYHQPSKI